MDMEFSILCVIRHVDHGYLPRVLVYDKGIETPESHPMWLVSRDLNIASSTTLNIESTEK